MHKHINYSVKCVTVFWAIVKKVSTHSEWKMHKRREKEGKGEPNKIDRQVCEARREATLSSSCFQVSWKKSFAKIF